jgi:hypothetical protein
MSLSSAEESFCGQSYYRPPQCRLCRTAALTIERAYSTSHPADCVFGGCEDCRRNTQYTGYPLPAVRATVAKSRADRRFRIKPLGDAESRRSDCETQPQKRTERVPQIRKR